MRGLGTAVNVATVLAGTGVGVLLGGRIPQRVRDTVLDGIGLIVIGVGIASFLATENAVFPVAAIVVGGLVGEWARIEDRLEGLGERLRRGVQRGGGTSATARDAGDTESERAGADAVAPVVGGTWVERDPDEVHLDADVADVADDADVGAPEGRSFVDGFVVASLTFCVGALVVVGSLQDGINGDPQLLIVKAALDGLVAVVFASVFGWGVGFSALSILMLQGSVTLLGATVGDALLDERMVAELEATGGVMIVGIGLRLLDLRKVRVGSYLPALAVAPLLVWLFAT